jgi:mono/diheme cytochrome c family protein
MKNIVFGTLIGCLFSMPSMASPDGEKLFQQLCVSCHVLSGQPTIAPPAFAVVNHLKQVYPQRDDFINRVVQWVQKPDASRSLMPGAIRRFGLMPTLPYSSQQVSQVAAYLYDSNLPRPGWYQKHYQQHHGKETQ